MSHRPRSSSPLPNSNGPMKLAAASADQMGDIVGREVEAVAGQHGAGGGQCRTLAKLIILPEARMSDGACWQVRESRRGDVVDLAR